MANTVIDALQKGRGRLEYIWHAGGMPWAVATSKTVISGLSSAHRQAMFGASVYSDGVGGSIYFADEVDIYPLLEVPGAIKIKSKEGIAELDGGDLTVKILNKPVVPTWPHGTRTIHGLEGLQAVANPRQDADVFVANLAAPLEKTETTIEIENDVGDKIGLDCENNAELTDPVFLWIGGECMACWDGENDDPISYCETQTSWRGLLNSKCQSFWPNVSNQPNIRVTNYPLNGIVARPWYLWAFLLDTDGVILDGPFRMHHGKIGNDISSDGAFWSVQCLPWWKWLDTDLEINSTNASIARYTFSRGDDGNGDAPHIQMKEYTSGSWSADTDVWLCSANSTATYDTLDELYDAILDAMATASPNSWTYEMKRHGPGISGPPSNSYFALRGAVPAIMGWGIPGGEWREWVDPWLAVCRNAPAYQGPWWGNATLEHWLYLSYAAGDTPDAPGEPGWAPNYILQWGTFDETDSDSSAYTWEASNLFPVPLDETGYTAPRIYVSEDHDVSDMSTEDILEIGREDFQMTRNYSSSTGEACSTLCTSAIAALGAGPPDNNYIDLVDDSPDFPLYGGAIVALRGQKGISDPDDGDLKFCNGFYMYHRPDLHEVDPWPVRQSFDVTAPSLGNMFRAILGDTTASITVAESVQADHIPDIDTISWDLIDDMVNDVEMGCDPSPKFRLRYSGKINLWSLINNELKLYNLQPTWEPVPDDDEFQMLVRKGGLINGTMAALGGRLIDQHVVASGQSIKAEQAAEFQYNKIDLSVNWKPDAEEWGKQFSINDTSGLAPTGGKTQTIKIEPRITRFPSIENNQFALIDYFAATLDQYMHPRPAQSAKATLRSSMDLGVGTLCLITLDNVQDPFDGTIGLVEWPAIVTERTFDPAKGQAAYKWALAFDQLYGWTPTLKITTSSDNGSNVVTVTDIGGSGQKYSGSGVSTGWYDHWFFADLEYNQTMAAPVAGDGGNYFVKLSLAESPWTIIDEVECYDVSTGTYAAVTGAAGAFFRLNSAGLSAAYDDTKEYYMTFVSYDSANITAPQKKYIHLADSSLELVDSGATAIMGREWK